MKRWKIALILLVIAVGFLIAGTIDYRALGLP